MPSMRIGKGEFEYVVTILFCLFLFIFIFSWSNAKVLAGFDSDWLKIKEATLVYGTILVAGFMIAYFLRIVYNPEKKYNILYSLVESPLGMIPIMLFGLPLCGQLTNFLSSITGTLPLPYQYSWSDLPGSLALMAFLLFFLVGFAEEYITTIPAGKISDIFRRMVFRIGPVIIKASWLIGLIFAFLFAALHVAAMPITFWPIPILGNLWQQSVYRRHGSKIGVALGHTITDILLMSLQWFGVLRWLGFA